MPKAGYLPQKTCSALFCEANVCSNGSEVTSFLNKKYENMKNSLFIFPIFVQLAKNVNGLWREKTVIEEIEKIVIEEKKIHLFLNSYLVLMFKIPS